MTKLTREEQAIETGEKLINWIKDYFVKNGSEDTKAIIGMSGGKDSLIAAALCVKALGPDRVLGVMMPNGEQKDIDDAIAAIKYLGIQSMTINIEDSVNAVYDQLESYFNKINSTVKTNTPPRIRMTTLYAIANMVGGRVINTSNASERYIGWTTKWGDNVGDLAPLADLTVRELLGIGEIYLNLPLDLLFKIPDDGMTGKSDEENLGFTYKELDAYILDNKYPSAETLYKINERYQQSKHKREAIPMFRQAGYFFRLPEVPY